MTCEGTKGSFGIIVWQHDSIYFVELVLSTPIYVFRKWHLTLANTRLSFFTYPLTAS